jgi:hypothetical protein
MKSSLRINEAAVEPAGPPAVGVFLAAGTTDRHS